MTDTRFGELEGPSDLAVTPQKHPHALPNRPWSGRAAPFAVAAMCLLVTAWSVREPGLTTDEPRYIENTERLHSWFGQLIDQGPTVAFQQQQQGDFGVALADILLEFSRCGVTLRAVRQVGELEDAFLKRLAEDRLRGFSRGIGIENGLAKLLQNDEQQPQETTS